MSNFMDWLTHDHYDLMFGNCGTFAIAVVREAQRRGISDVGLAFAHNAETDEEMLWGDYSLYHVAIFIGDKIYDARGEISESQLTDFDENISKDAYIDYFDTINLDKMQRSIEKNTDWYSTPEDFAELAKTFLDSIANENT